MRDVCNQGEIAFLQLLCMQLVYVFLLKHPFEHIFCSHLSIWATPKHSNSQRSKDPNTKNLSTFVY